MAIVYLRSTDGLDTDDGSTWALAKATLVAACTAAGAGGTVYVSQAHAETQAANMTIAASGTPGAPIDIICVNDSATPPTTKATTATVSATGASTMGFTGHANVYGITFNNGAGSGSLTSMNWNINAAMGWTCTSCVFNIVGNNASNRFNIGYNAATITQSFRFVNCTFTFTSTFQQIIPGRGRTQFIGCTFAPTGSIPTTLFVPGNGGVGPVSFRGCDFSTFGSGKTLISGMGSAIGGLIIRLTDCKLGASVTVVGTTFAGTDSGEVWLDNCDSGDTNYRFQRSMFEGGIFSETVIVRTGGASDGVTPISHRFVSDGGISFLRPFYGPWITLRNELTGSAKTLTIEIVHDNTVALKNNEVWVEVEHLGTSGFPEALFADDRVVDVLTTAADQDSSSVAWTTTGITNVKKQKLVATFTPQEKGVVRCRVVVAKPSYTLYVDPDPVIA